MKHEHVVIDRFLHRAELLPLARLRLIGEVRLGLDRTRVTCSSSEFCEAAGTWPLPWSSSASGTPGAAMRK